MPFATVNGLRLHYEWHGEEGGTPLVLVMGLGGDSTAWPFQLAAFVARHRVLVFDNRGAGQSDAPDVAYTTRGMAEDLLGLLDGLGVGRAHLLGLSLGGAIAQEAVLAAPERFASLQLHATWAGPHPYFEALVHAVRMARREFDLEGFYRALSVWLFTPALLRDPARAGGDGRPAGDPPRAPAPAPRLSPADRRRAGPRRARPPAPDPVPHAGRGRQPGSHHAARARRRAGEPDPGRAARRLPDVGHGALWEAPDAFNRLCLDFLDGVRL